MKKTSLALALLAATFGAQATSSATSSLDLSQRAGWFAGLGLTPTYTETFETVPVAKDALHASFSQAGITYEGLAGSPGPNVFVSSPGYLNYGPGLNPTSSSILTANGDEAFKISFVAPVFAVALDAYTNGFGPVTVSFYNGATLLGSVGVGSGTLQSPEAGSLWFIGLSNDEGITHLMTTSVAGGSLNTGIDNLAVAAVPEPQTWALMGLGLAALGVAQRRRKATRA